MTRLAAGRAFDPAVLARLARRPTWLAGLAAVIAGFALQAAALGLGRLVVIEPVLASGLLFALVLAARRERRPLSRAEWAAALAVVGGLAVFLAVGQPSGGQRTASAAALGLAVAAAAGLVIYHERLSAGPGQVVVELAACAAAAWGIARLAGLATRAGQMAGPRAWPRGDRSSPGVPAGR